MSKTVLSAAFSGDGSLFTVSTTDRFMAYANDKGELKRVADEACFGGMNVVLPIFRSPLFILVPSGDTPGTSPRRLKLWNALTKRLEVEIEFPSAIQRCSVNRSYLVVGTDETMVLYAVASMTKLYSVPVMGTHPPIMDLTTAEPTSLLAYCAIGNSQKQVGLSDAVDCTKPGEVAIFDCGQMRVVSRIAAHRSPVAVVTFSCCGTMLSMASVSASLVRIFLVPSGECLYELRHSLPSRLAMHGSAAGGWQSVGGSAGAAVTALSFCPRGEFLLSVSADATKDNTGYSNVFRLSRECREGGSQAGAEALRESVALDSGQEFVEVERSEVPAADSSSDTAQTSSSSLILSWPQQLAAQAAQGFSSAQALTRQYMVAAVNAAGNSVRLAAGHAAVLHVRIHRQVVEDEGVAAGPAAESSGRAGARPGFHASLSYCGRNEQLTLSVISSDRGVYRRYGLGFLQQQRVDPDGGVGADTLTLSDAHPSDGSAEQQAVVGCGGEGCPRTLGEALEEECLLLV